jgi:hypothetical protein
MELMRDWAPRGRVEKPPWATGWATQAHRCAASDPAATLCALMSELQAMSDDAVGPVDEQIAQMTERLIAIFEDEIEWTQKQGESDRLTQLLEGAREAELLVKETAAGRVRGLQRRVARPSSARSRPRWRGWPRRGSAGAASRQSTDDQSGGSGPPLAPRSRQQRFFRWARLVRTSDLSRARRSCAVSESP